MKAKAMWIILAAVLLLAVSAGGYAVYQYKQKKEYQEKYADIDAVKAAVAAELLDGESARFRNVRKVGGFVCGEVNGKNLYGAYTGFVEFIGSPGTTAIGTPAMVTMNSGYWKSLYADLAKGRCAQAGRKKD